MSYTEPPLHPELARLAQHYDQLVEDVSGRRLAFDDAAATLAQMTVIDGKGALWGLNTDGDFIRAWPGQAAEITDARLFAPAQIPTAPPTPADTSATAGRPPWAPTWPAAPVVAPPGGRGADPGGIDWSGKAAGLVDLAGDGVSAVASWVRPRKRIVAVGAVVAALLGVIAFTSGTSGHRPGGGGGIPVATTTGSPTRPGAPLPTNAPTSAPATGGPTSGGPATGPTTGNPAVALPSITDAQIVIGDLTSGKRSQVAAAAVTPGAAASVAAVTAFYYGAAHTGMTVGVSGNPAATAGGAAWTLAISDKGSAAVSFSVPTLWAHTAAGWKLATLPALPAGS